jgi:hypothetical protein
MLAAPGLASARSPWSMVLEVELDGAIAGPSSAGPFSVTGGVFRRPTSAVNVASNGAERVGTYRAWGWAWDPSRPLGGSGAVQSFELTGRGEIVLTGMHDAMASITGGTGDFRGASGQAEIVPLGASAFQVTFDLTSLRAGPT